MAFAGPAMVMMLLTLGGWSDGQQLLPEGLQFVRLKPADAEMRRLIVDGYQRSETFRSLTHTINQSNAIVVVQYGQCSRGRFRSCVTDVQGDQRQRYIRIKIATRTTGDRLTATIAHELAHAAEILRDPTITSSAATLAMYRKIAIGRCRLGVSDECETQHALDVERQVLIELDRASRVARAQ